MANKYNSNYLYVYFPNDIWQQIHFYLTNNIIECDRCHSKKINALEKNGEFWLICSNCYFSIKW